MTCVSHNCVPIQPCETVDKYGCCDEGTLKVCKDGQLETTDCANDPLCGWNDVLGAYSCGTLGDEDPLGEHLIACVGCVPDCDGKECGDDGCGDNCGECECGESCITGGCVFTACQGKECGDDGCGGECGQCPLANDTCEEGQCICIPSCANKFCGDNGCGGSCGVCDEKFVCLGAVCACIPSCEDKECGSDGCLGSCGFCDKPLVCKLYACQCSYGHCVPGDNLDEVCGGTSPGNCGEWQCVDGCCEVYQTPPPECCQTSEDCRDCINLETAETTDCPLAIPEGFVTDMCTDDVCGFGNKCKHFHKAVFGECNDDDDCTKDSCEPETGLCTHTPIEGCE